MMLLLKRQMAKSKRQMKLIMKEVKYKEQIRNKNLPFAYCILPFSQKTSTNSN